MKKIENNFYGTYEEYIKTEDLEECILREMSEIYTYEIKNKHDKIFKDILNDKEEARKFINKYLKLKVPIQKNNIEPYNSSYINSLYQNKEADIVYKKVDQNIFFLIEHQSTIDMSMPYRIENYSMEIINTAVEKEKMRRKDYLYPKVIALVLYTGHKKWNAKLSFSDTQEKLEGYEEIDRNYNIIDINNYSKKELLEDESFISKVLLLETSKSQKEFIENAKIVRKRTTKDKLEQIDKIIAVMLTRQMSKENCKEILENLRKEGGNEKVELAVERMFERENKKLIKQGKREGKIEGKIEGIRETTLQIAKKLIDEGASIEFINKITGLDKEKIKKLYNL